MGDSENKEVVLNEVKADKPEAEKEASVKKADKSAKDKSAKKKSGFFRSLKAEFKKIVWPDKETTVKETTAVVVVTVILGAIIADHEFVINPNLLQTGREIIDTILRNIDVALSDGSIIIGTAHKRALMALLKLYAAAASRTFTASTATPL